MSQRSQLKSLKQQIHLLKREYKRLKLQAGGGNNIIVKLSKTVGNVRYFTGDRLADPGSDKHKFIQAVVEHIKGQPSTTFKESGYIFTCNGCEAGWNPLITAEQRQIHVSNDAVAADVYELTYKGDTSDTDWHKIQSCTSRPCTPTPLQVHTTPKVNL